MPVETISPVNVNGEERVRIPVVVPRTGDHVVNVSTLWPDRSPRDGVASPRVKSPAATASMPFGNHKSGAEQIMSERTGALGHGAVVAEDGNVHADPKHKRPIVLLPDCCEGKVGLKIPELIKGHIANVTLPSRLALLGRQSYETIAAINPINLGNSVVGFAPVWGRRHVRNDLYVLPTIFSKGGARIYIFLRILLFLVFLVFFFQFAQVWNLNIGRAWFFGSSIAIYIMYRLALIRRAPDGVMAFCRSMGAPEIEEYMFSYSWKVEPDAIRTLAKAVWNNNVGVWIDVVKLCPGDEIRPMVRTMVNRVYRCVVFMSPAYISSPNCCVEFHEAVQWPSKLIICILQPVPALMPFLKELEAQGAVLVDGLRELIGQLDDEICDVNDASAWKWWRKQKISGGGVPSHVVPTYWHTIPRFSLNVTNPLRTPPRSLTAGPVFLAGDCSSAGIRFFPPYLFFLGMVAVVSNFVDIYYTFSNNDCSTTIANDIANCPNKNCHQWFDYIWLGIIAMCNVAPFTAWSSLFETRTDVHPVMRPLLASKSMNGGVKITIVGHETDPIVMNLNRFLTQIGHNARDRHQVVVEHTEGAVVPADPTGSPSLGRKKSRLAQEDAPVQKRVVDHAGIVGFSRSITVYVMRDFVQRDALFGKDEFPFDPRTSLFIWSNPSNDPFTKDSIGERLMRFLVLVAAWDRNLLAENLFSAIGVRVVDMLHGAADADVEDEGMLPDESLQLVNH